MGIEEVIIAARSPWQNPCVERLFGGLRRECLDHVIVVNERHLRRGLARYSHYYHRWRTHQALAMDSPRGREAHPVVRGRVVEVSDVVGLHHRL